MLASLLGIRLILLTGQNVPTPAPYDVMTSLAQVEVTNDAEQGDGFQMTFSLGKEQSPDYSLLQSGQLDPFTLVTIAVLMGATPEALINGVITHHQLAPSNEPGMTTLTVSGRDVSVMMDLEEVNAPYSWRPDFAIVTQILLNYMQYGLIGPNVITPTTDIPIDLQRTPRQHETDLQFIRRMARRNGFVFYVEPVTLGVSRAFWGPASRVGLPQPALTMNMGPRTNVTELSFTLDGLSPESASGTFIDPIFKMSLPIPTLPSLRVPPLASSPTPAKRKVLMRQTANESPVQAALAALSTTTNAPDSVIGTGTLDAVRYGSVLRARSLVGVRGTGSSYDGMYYVSKVTHRISKGAYTQGFTIKREGTGTLLPVVVP